MWASVRVLLLRTCSFELSNLPCLLDRLGDQSLQMMPNASSRICCAGAHGKAHRGYETNALSAFAQCVQLNCSHGESHAEYITWLAAPVAQ
mmetsp:Transcript_20413/g.43138  ORF Transcript_20413/g.43138 Transcript_20413/m.43138 type:complete len:91 (-) Transcript_20413:577-849(-)